MQAMGLKTQLIVAVMIVLLAVTIPCAMVGCGGSARGADVPRTAVNFQSMKFVDGFSVLVAKVGLLAFCGVLNGNFVVDGNGDITGTGAAQFIERPGTLITVTMAAAFISFVIGGVAYEIRKDLADTLYVDGSPTSMTGALAIALGEMTTLAITAWGGYALLFAVIAMIFGSSAFQYNMAIALVLGLGSPLLYALWMKADFIIWMLAAYPLFTLGVTLCAAALAACSGEPYAVVAGRRLPCVFFTAICVAGVFVGFGSAYSAWVTDVWQQA